MRTRRSRGNTHHLSELFKRLEEGKNAVTVGPCPVRYGTPRGRSIKCVAIFLGAQETLSFSFWILESLV